MSALTGARIDQGAAPLWKWRSQHPAHLRTPRATNLETVLGKPRETYRITANIVNHAMINIIIAALHIHCTSDTRTSISAIIALWIRSRGSGVEGGEDAVDDWLSVDIRTRLQTGVADLRHIHEAELDGEVVAGLMDGVGH